jgi:hypothetical protein
MMLVINSLFGYTMTFHKHGARVIREGIASDQYSETNVTLVHSVY